MKFLVVGHLCLDVVHPVDGSEVQGYGGIYYSLVTLASLLDSTDAVLPVFGVNKADYPELIEHLHRFPNIDTSGIFKFDEPTNRVHLYYQDTQTRIECSRDIARPIPYEKIRRRLAVDGVLINMISGFDITIETLDHIRMTIRSHNIPIHFDYHSLTLGVNPNFERFRRPLSDWRRWAFMADTVQLNEEEIAGLSIERMTEPQTVGHLLTLGVKGVVLTRGERGASLFYNDHKHVVQKDLVGINAEQVRDTTGCGDVFGAAFHLQYVRTRDLLGATQFANHLAGARTRFVGTEGLETLKDIQIPLEG
jgi:adenosine kinase